MIYHCVHSGPNLEKKIEQVDILQHKLKLDGLAKSNLA